MEANDGGWYARLVLPDAVPRTQWVTIDKFWLCTFRQRRDRSPALVYHLSGAEVSDALSETGQLHSIKLTLAYPCSYKSICLFTPNQFDIADIKKAIREQQENWNTFFTTTEPELPQSFTVGMTGKFIFRPSDRLTVTIQKSSLTVQQLNEKDHVLPFDQNFDSHPSLEDDNDVRWIEVHFTSGTATRTLRLHCSDVGEMMKMVTVLLHCKARIWANRSD
jgi:hypothetical protein